MPEAKHYNIAIIFPRWYSFLSEVMKEMLAIHEIRSHCSFSNFISYDFSKPVKFPQGYKPDGIMVSYDDALFDATWLDDLDIPVVNLFGSIKKTYPTVSANSLSVVRTVVEHFTQLNYEKIGVLGTTGSSYKEQLYQAFEEECAKQNLPLWKIDLPDGIPPGEWYRLENEAPELKEKLLNPEGKTGIYTSHDIRGNLLIGYCNELGVSIPEDIGVLGRFNTIKARFCTPELSSIVLPTSQIGAQAMQLLIHLIEGDEVDDLHPTIDVKEVRVRASTVAKADTDMVVLQARSIIRENACRGLTVDELVQSLPLSRSTFEKRYRAMTGSSPANHIREIRVEKARQLLLTTKKTVDEIAFDVGFNDPRPFVVFFKREIGDTPGEFRIKFTR